MTRLREYQFLIDISMFIKSAESYGAFSISGVCGAMKTVKMELARSDPRHFRFSEVVNMTKQSGGRESNTFEDQTLVPGDTTPK